MFDPYKGIWWRCYAVGAHFPAMVWLYSSAILLQFSKVVPSDHLYPILEHFYLDTRYKGRGIIEWFDDKNGVNDMLWPLQSGDFNLVKHLEDILDIRHHFPCQ